MYIAYMYFTIRHHDNHIFLSHENFDIEIARKSMPKQYIFHYSIDITALVYIL